MRLIIHATKPFTILNFLIYYLFLTKILFNVSYKLDSLSNEKRGNEMKRFGKICLMIVLFSLVGAVIGNFFEISQSVQMISGFIMGVIVTSVVKK